MDVVTGETNAVPLTVLTGFLGAGKTTLLNRILTTDHGLRVGVLVNDFGSINIDAELVVDVDGGVTSLANGCVCCEIRDDLIESLAMLLARPERIEYVLLEASGVADPGGIFVTFNDDQLRDRVRLDGIICIVDAEQVLAHPEYPALLDLKLRQVGFADMVILNKAGLAGPEQLARVHAWLDDHFNRLRIVEADYCDVPNEILLGAGKFDPGRADRDAHLGHEGCTEESHDDDVHEHSTGFSAWSYETDQPLDLERLRATMKKLPGNIYRAKGVVYTADAPHQRTILQVVGRRVDVSLHEEWGERTPYTKIVAIGAAGTLDAALLEQTLASCTSSGPAAATRVHGPVDR